jgi:cytidine deaminase
LDDSYSPYSNFKVAAVILLENGATVTGTNQENAAYPAGICAEGTALGVASSLHPNVPIQKIAITVKSGHQPIKYPVAPCGICRQRLLEYEQRFEKDIEVILTGQTELTYRVKSVKDLLPLYFSDKDL